MKTRVVLGKLGYMATPPVVLNSLDGNDCEDRTPLLHFFVLPTAWRAGCWVPHCTLLEGDLLAHRMIGIPL